jgi:poly-gamma-glutamate capsule biosynthesis protein CapA/YwtB (metallophosphatase superfamily)
MNSRFAVTASSLLLLALSCCRVAVAQETTYTMFAGGDVMLARWINEVYYQRDREWSIGGVASLARGADVALVNLESVISAKGELFYKGRESRPYHFRGRPELIDYLTDLGIDVVATANNHTLDFGPEAVFDQRRLLGEAGIATFGEGNDIEEATAPVYVRVGELTVAFLGLENEFPGVAATGDRPGVAHAQGDAIVTLLEGPVKEARRHADLVVFSPHWLQGAKEVTTDEAISVSRRLIDMGVDVVLGHGPHLIQGIESYNNRPIIYSTGNLFFDRSSGQASRSAAFLIEFGRDGVTQVTIRPVEVTDARVTLASGGNLEQTILKLQRMTRRVDPDLDLVREGSTLVARFSPPPCAAPLEPPPRAHLAGSTRRLPDDLRRQTDVVLERLPSWAAGFEPRELSHGITVLGARNAQAARPRAAFTAEVLVRVGGPLEGNWRAMIAGVRRGGDRSFVDYHPFAGGAWPVPRWEAGQLLVDRTLVRPPRMPAGIYDLFWGMERVGTDERTGPLQTRARHHRQMVPFGVYQVLKHGIPSTPAGMAWHGRLPRGYAPLVPLGAMVGGDPDVSPAQSGWASRPLLWLAIGLAIGLAVLALVFGALRLVGARRRS